MEKQETQETQETKKTLPAKIEPVPVNSPLLQDEVIVRDYTSGIESQVSGPAAPSGPDPSSQETGGAPGTPTDAGPPGSAPPPSGNEYTLDPEAEKLQDVTREFTFKDDLGAGAPGGAPGSAPGTAPGSDKSPVDAESGEGDAFVIPEASAKAFADMIGNAVGIYVPKFSYDAVKIDMKNVRFHVREGNLSPEFTELFALANENTEEALKFDPEEIKMLKKATKDYLEYKNVGFANPETAFWATVGIMATKQFYVINNLKKENRKLVLDALKITNPGMFKDYKDEGKARDNVADVKDQSDEQK